MRSSSQSLPPSPAPIAALNGSHTNHPILFGPVRQPAKNPISMGIVRLRSSTVYVPLYKESPPQRELVDVNGIIREMLKLLKGEAERCSVAMRTELAAELPNIIADRVQLQQVFMNLMLNAIEAMKDSGGELTVKIGTAGRSTPVLAQ